MAASAEVAALPRPVSNKRDLWTPFILGLSALVAVVSFIYPFFQPPASRQSFTAGSHAADAPFVFTLLMLLLLAVVIAQLETRRLNSKMVAVLGILVAMNALVRLIPSVMGLSPLFLLIVLTGYVYGPTFGFLQGSLALFVSAILTGGVGPWLPFEMFGAGWVGLTAGWLPKLGNDVFANRRELLMLAAFGGVWGLLYGAILNLWFWPFSGAAYAPGSAIEVWQRYMAFYLSTSLPYDVFRAAGNVVLILFLGRAIIPLLRRFQRRFHFVVG